MTDKSQIKAFIQARTALISMRDQLMFRSALLAVGVGLKKVGGELTDEPCIKAFVPRKIPLEKILPGRAVPRMVLTAVGVVRTDVEEMLPPTSPPWLRNTNGEFEPYWIGNRFRHRPIMSGGDSVSHSLAPLGTISTEVNDPLQPDVRYILSCNHILAALSWAWPGDPVVQPAFGDGGRVPIDTCGFIDRWVPIRFGTQGLNRVDAAIARVDDARGVVPWVRWIGIPMGIRSGNLMYAGETVSKVGRTTLVTYGTVVATDVSGWINYPWLFGGGGPAFFERQIVTTGMAAFGDSGSLLFDSEHNVVGLLFGGSPTLTFYNDIIHVQDELRIQIAFR